MSNPPIIEVQYDVLEQVASQFNQQADLISDLTKRIDRQADNLLGNGWQGQGSDRFEAELYGQVLPKLKRLSDALDESQRVALNVMNIMQDAEEQAKGIFDGSGDVFTDVLGNGLGSLTEDNIWDIIGSRLGVSGVGVKDLSKLVSKQISEKLAKYLAEQGGIKMAGWLAASTTTQEGFEAVLDYIDNGDFIKHVGFMKGGLETFAGGTLDWAFGDNHSLEEFGVQIASEGLQKLAIAFVPGAKEVMAINEGVQILGTGYALVGDFAATQFESMNPELAQDLRESTARFRTNLEGMDLDTLADGMVRSTVEGFKTGDWSGFEREFNNFTDSAKGTLSSGIEMGGHLLEGAGQYIAENPQVDEFFTDVGEGISDFGNDLGNAAKSVWPF